MDFHDQKSNLSFSIENILRDDFPSQQRHPRTNVVTLPKQQSRFGRGWPIAPLFRCYAVRYSPVYVRLLPNHMQRVGARLHQVNRVKELILAQQSERIEEDCLSCNDEKNEEIHRDDGKEE